jgi:hypothetical protein
MGKVPVHTFVCCVLLFLAAACIPQPALADDGTISIAYRGSGGGYVGDTVVFDGRNTYGNTTLIRITGPGLPAEGVPAANLNGPAGTGTPVRVDPDGTWKYTWYSSSVPGTEKLQTWRYTFVATDSVLTDKTATSRFMLRKPEIHIEASPDPVTPGGYVELTGMAETGGDSAKIDIADSSGKILHSFTSPVSASGSFSYSFHVDMGPGQYTVTVHCPALKDPFGTVITVAPEGDTKTVSPDIRTSVQATAPPAMEPAGTPVPVSPSRTDAAGSPVNPGTVIAALTALVVLAGRGRQ